MVYPVGRHLLLLVGVLLVSQCQAQQGTIKRSNAEIFQFSQDYFDCLAKRMGLQDGAYISAQWTEEVIYISSARHLNDTTYLDELRRLGAGGCFYDHDMSIDATYHLKVEHGLIFRRLLEVGIDYARLWASEVENRAVDAHRRNFHILPTAFYSLWTFTMTHGHPAMPYAQSYRGFHYLHEDDDELRRKEKYLLARETKIVSNVWSSYMFRKDNKAIPPVLRLFLLRLVRVVMFCHHNHMLQCYHVLEEDTEDALEADTFIHTPAEEEAEFHLVRSFHDLRHFAEYCYWRQLEKNKLGKVSLEHLDSKENGAYTWTTSWNSFYLFISPLIFFAVVGCCSLTCRELGVYNKLPFLLYPLRICAEVNRVAGAIMVINRVALLSNLHIQLPNVIWLVEDLDNPDTSQVAFAKWPEDAGRPIVHSVMVPECVGVWIMNRITVHGILCARLIICTTFCLAYLGHVVDNMQMLFTEKRLVARRNIKVANFFVIVMVNMFGIFYVSSIHKVNLMGSHVMFTFLEGRDVLMVVILKNAYLFMCFFLTSCAIFSLLFNLGRIIMKPSEKSASAEQLDEELSPPPAPQIPLVTVEEDGKNQQNQLNPLPARRSPSTRRAAPKVMAEQQQLSAMVSALYAAQALLLVVTIIPQLVQENTSVWLMYWMQDLYILIWVCLQFPLFSAVMKLFRSYDSKSDQLAAKNVQLQDDKAESVSESL